MILSRKKFRFPFLFSAAALSLFLFSFQTNLFAKIEQWNFEDSAQYQYDPQKVILEKGSARLVSSEPFRDKTQKDFDQGSYELNTTAARGTLELAAQRAYEISGPEIPAPVLNADPSRTALWKMDEPSGTNLLDEASRTVAKASDAEVVSSQTGFGFARAFDGSKSHIFIPNYETFKFSEAFTLEAWIRPQSAVSSKPQTLMARWQQAGAQKSFAFQITPEGKLDFVVSPDGALSKHHSGDSVLASGVWQHVAVTFDGKDTRIYLNGILDSKPQPLLGSIHQVASPIYLGALINNKLDEFYRGSLDEVSFYQRALNESELLTHAGNARGLVGLWHLNERGGPLADASGFGQHAMPVQKIGYEAEGRLNNAVQLDGKKEAVEVPPSSRFAVSGTLTLQAWVKPKKLPGLGEAAAIISSIPDPQKTDEGAFALFLGPSGTLRAAASGINPIEITGKTPLMPNVWQHVAVTWAQGRASLYVNGSLDASSIYKGSIQTGRSGLRFGMDTQGIAPFAGSLDEVAVYRRAKTQLEIAADAGGSSAYGIYTSSVKDAGSESDWRAFSWKEALPYAKGISVDEIGLLHLYHFDEKEQTFQDLKGGNSATAVGTYPVYGIFSPARWFQNKGSDKIISQKNFPALSTFTISFWFQFASSQPGISDRLFSIGDQSLTAFRGQDGRIRVSMQGAREVVSESLVQDTRWHHFVLSADGRNLFLYIDGLPDGNSPFTSASQEAPLILGNLKSLDTFQGAVDEFAFFNAPLSRENVMKHYFRAKQNFIFQVRSSNEPSMSSLPWKDLDGNERKEQSAEPTTVGLWHFNESKYTGRQQEIKDASRFSSHGSLVGRPSSIPVGASGAGMLFNGSSDHIEVPGSESLHVSSFTLSAWIKPRQVQEQDMVILDKHYLKGAPSFSSYALEVTSGNRLNLRIGYGRGYTQIQTDTAGDIAAGRWNHVSATYDGKEVRLYINGMLRKVEPFRESVIYDRGNLFIGRYGASAARFFDGEMDEVSIDSKVLTADEIAERYASLRTPIFRTTEGKLKINRGRYFQYRVLLASEVPASGPHLQETEVLANFFPTSRPSIHSTKGISYAHISSFSHKLGAGNRGSVSYQLSNDGANWFYHNGRRWVIASGYSESNTAEQIQTRIHDFSKEIGIGSFYFKAFLHSPTGLEPVELENVEIEYLPNKLTMTSPNGSEAWVAGSDHAITWNSTGEIQKVDLEYSKDDFKSDFHPIARGISNTGSYTWTVPDDLGVQVKVRVIDGLEPRIYDVSDLSFRITGAFEIVSPNWNERWQVGSAQEIVWKTTGTVPHVKLDFSTDDFVKSIYPIVDSVKNEGKYTWKVTNPISSNVKVRVSDVRDLLTFDKSNDVFAIHGNLQFHSPAAGDRWIVGSRQEIRWENTGPVPMLRLEYKTSADDEWKLLAENIGIDQKSFAWIIPDDIDGKAVLRISDMQDRKVFALSPEFGISGGFRIENPTGGENWSIGSRRKIVWQTVGTVPAVNLEYKLSSADEWIPIAKAVANTGSYVWDIPEQPADLVAIRITDAAGRGIEAESTVPSRIVPAFTVKSPNGGENFKIGSETDIVWDTRGKVETVKLEYSKDGFAKDVHTIIEAASNIGRFAWKVPDDASASVKVRVSASEIASSQDLSDGDFRIYSGFKFTAPLGGEKYEVGSLATLTWETSGTVPRVRLEYSHDDFVKDVRVIANDIANEGRYTWTVPDDIGVGYSLRISDLRDEKTRDFSQGFFAIIGNFKILEPVGGESYTAGAVTQIKWKGAGSVPFVRIDYSEDDFEKTFQTIAEQAPNTGSYDWLMPNLIGHEFKIRVWDPSHPDAQDIMEKPARIIGGFRLLAPNGGEVIHVGDSVDIKWEVLGTVPAVKIEYSMDHFQNSIGEITDAYENTGTYHWQVPDLPAGRYMIRVSDPRDAAANDLSNSEFKIRSKFLVVSPNGGEGWAVGETKPIIWQTTGSVPAVNLEYSIDDFASVKLIAEKVPNTGSYEWVVADHVAQNVKVRVSDANDFEAHDVSDGSFRIQGVLTLESPAGGEVWKAGEQRVIKWRHSGRIEGVRLEYSHDNFASEIKTIAESIPNTGSYNWTVPDDISANTKVRVLDLKDLRTYSASENVFQIAGAFRLMSPSGGDRWHASEKREIVWATIGTVREVNLEYSKDDFATEPEVIDRGVLNTGKFTWELPRDMGDQFKVRVCDADHPKICDASDSAFSIESPFEFTYPKGGEFWQVGSEQELRWNVYGYIPRAVIQYAVTDPAAEWKTLAAEIPNEGRLFFKVPDDISKTVRFRIADFEDADVASVTEVPVQVVGTFQLMTPNGGEKWLASSTQKITWKTLGTAPEVRLEYSDDDFKHSVKLIESSYKNTGSYEWKIPADLSLAVKVRVMDASNDASFDLSDESFKILPHFTVLSPNGAERWISGEKVQLQWKTEGEVPRVRLEYGMKEEGAADYSWQPIAEVRGQQQAYDWTLPAQVSSDVKIRVYDEREAETTDESDAPFKILARFRNTAPRAGEIITTGEKYAIKWETDGKVPSVKLDYALRSAASENVKPLEYLPIENYWTNSGVYYWTVPDTAGEDIVIRVSDAREPEAFSEGESFRIRGALKFDMPEGDLLWPVGSQQTLRWKTTGTISQVRLEYSGDGKTWKLIEESLPNSDSYGWLVPNDLLVNARLRISNVQNPAVFHELDRPVNIYGEFKFLNPETDQKWIVGTKEMIQWKTTGGIQRVWLDYTADGFKWNSVAGPIENTGQFEWTIPDTITPSAKLRIKDPDNAAAFAFSKPFKIQGKLEVAVPQGGEVWEVASSKKIEWKTTGTIPYVRIEGYWENSAPSAEPVYGPQLPAPASLEAAAPEAWFIISAQEENRGSYTWTVPDKISDKFKIRVTDVRDSAIAAVSQGTFSVVGTLRMVNPKGGETWTVGEQRQVVWASQGAIEQIQLEYSRDDFYRDINLIASGVPNTGAALWVVPDAIAQSLKIRASDVRDKRVFHVSNAFAVQGKLEFITPYEGAVLKAASEVTPFWKTTGTIPRVRLEYSRDDFRRDVQVIENDLENKETYEWKVPDIVSTTVKLRVMDLRDARVAAVSAPFKVEGTLRLKSPVGGEKLQAFSSHKILWDTIGPVNKIRLEYSKDDFNQDIHLIAAEVENGGSYEWIVPDDITSGIKVRILDASNYAVESTSPQPFKVHGALSFSMNTAQARWSVSAPQEISWQTIGAVPKVRLEYSKDDFQKDIQLIADQAANEGKYSWFVPDDISSNIRLRVSDARDFEVFAVTDVPASIVGRLKLNTPEKDSVLKVGEEVAVKWDTIGTIPGIRMEYQTAAETSSNSPEVWKMVSGLADNRGEFLWRVPNDISAKVKIRISDARDALTQNTSQDMAIAGKVNLISPAGGERWIVGTNHEILWQSTGTIEEVTLQFSMDGFKKDARVIAEKIPNSGRWVWSVPDAISNGVQVRVQDPRMTEWVSHTSMPFSIAGDFVIAPAVVPLVYKVGEEVRLQWQTAGTIPQVRIEYIFPQTWPASFRNHPSDFVRTLATGLSWAPPAAAVSVPSEPDVRILQDKVPNQGYYSFHIPDAIGQGRALRISDVRDPRTVQVFPAFKIEGALAWQRPAPGEIWRVGSEQILEWKTTGTIPAPVLEYSSDHFQKDIRVIQQLTVNQNRLLWTVPDMPGGLKIRIRDSRDEKIAAVSEEVKIHAAIEILRPQAQDALIVGTRREIQWKTDGTVPQVRLEYSSDGFKKDARVIEHSLETSRLLTQEGNYSYLWDIPDAISDYVQVRVSDVREGQVFGLSQPFKIRGAFEMVLPQGGEKWSAGSRREIKWKSTGVIPQVRLEYSRDGFKKDVQIIAAGIENTGSYEWPVADAVHSRIWVRVADQRDASVWASHQSPIEVHGTLHWISPRAAEVWKVGDRVQLEWKSGGTIPEVKLEYIPSEGMENSAGSAVIAPRIPNRGSFTWELPDSIPPQIQFKVSDVIDPEVHAVTSMPSRVLGVLKLVSPDASAVWPIGSTQEIVWQSRGFIPQVKVEASRDGFQKETLTLFPLLPNAGSVKWTVEDYISKQFQIRVSDSQNPSVFTVNSAPIEVVGGFQILTPVSGAVLEVGAKEEISWKTTGTIPEVRIEYSSDRFNHPMIIAEKVPNSGRYLWEVPDVLGDGYLIRVSDAQRPEMAAISEMPFAIQGRLILKTPQGGEIWKVGSDAEIIWDSIGSIAQVGLEYSTDEFVRGYPIVQNLANRGKFTWRIPDIVSEKVKVRVYDTKKPSVYSASVQPLKIQGELAVMAPQGGEFWEIGTQHMILWQTIGSIPFVTIEYSTDNFATAVPVILGTANEGRYAWTVPNLDAGKVKFRVMDAHDSSVTAFSPQIEIGGALKLISPQGGETLQVQDEAVIEWKTSGTIPRVRIEVSTDDFTNVIRTLESSVANDNRYSWKIPDAIAGNYKVRVSDASNPRISDRSKGVFKVAGALRLLSPKGGERWTVGSSQPIEWQSIGTIQALRLEYTKDNFASTVPIETQLKNSGRYTWEVPDLSGEKIQFKISDAADPSVSDQMIAEVQIKAALDLISPRGGEIWRAKEPQTISWKTTGTVPYVTLDYSLDDFKQTAPIAASISNTGSFLWNVPDISARRLSLRVSDSLNTDVFSELLVPIQVTGELKVTSPAGGEVWLVGSQHPITWSSAGKIERVRLEYSTDGYRTIFPIASAIANTGQYNWTVPDAVSKQVSLRVVHQEDPGVSAQTGKDFEIRGALNLLTPVGGESWVIGSRHPISWQTTGTLPQVKLEYSTDGFISDIQTLVPSLDNKGVYYFEVPSVSAPGIQVRVSDPLNPDVYDMSKSRVNLQGQLTLLSPVGGESYQVGARAEVLWRATPNIANVKLEYSLDHFETSRVISDYVPNTGKFVWNLPNQISEDWKVRVSDAANQSVFSFSKFPFRTHGALELMSPKGGELWPAGSNQTISWNTLGAIEKVRIEYSSDGFETSLPIAASVSNTGTYLWTVPEIPHSEVRLRVTDARSPNIFSASQGAVRIVGDIKIQTPAAGERWVVGEERVIRWQTKGYMPQVDIEYSKDEFNKDIHLIAAKVPNVGSYSWQVPNDPSNEMRLRIRSSENHNLSAVSENPFRVDFYQIRWNVRDFETRDPLSGLSMTDSTGKTIARAVSPANYEYPYGIYTTVWTKAGYAEHRSTWLADRDRTFEVYLEPQKEKVEIVRASFEYDRVKDFMNVSSWYEKDGKPVPTVIQAEVKIYKDDQLVKALMSTTPDTLGYFRMLWDTAVAEGNSKYFASVAITTASGKTLTSPISYQLDIPVKERKEPEVKRAIPSMFLRPLGLSPSPNLVTAKEDQMPKRSDMLPLKDRIQAPSQEAAAPPMISAPAVSIPAALTPVTLSVQAEKSSFREPQLMAPERAVVNETISITYISSVDSRPVLDLYNADRKLVIRAQPLKPGDQPGTFNALIPISGAHFIPGKSVRISVIELATGKYRSADMLIASGVQGLGYEKQVSGNTVLEILQRLDLAIREINRAEAGGRNVPEVLDTLNSTFMNLGGLLSEEALHPKIFEKLNEIAENLALFAEKKGYRSDFVTANPLKGQSSLQDVTAKMKNLKSLVESLQRLYSYAAGVSTPSA